MAIKLDKEAFDRIDHEFVNIMNNENRSGATANIAKILSEVFDKQFDVTITMPKRNDPFYIMSVFPEQSTLDKLVLSIVNEESDSKLGEIWKDNEKWTIEIDNRILTGSFVDANSRELTALLLHEIGHVMESKSIPNRMSKIIKYEFAKSSIGTKSVLKYGAFKKVLQIPILRACVFENYKTNAAMKRELRADLFAVKMGYGKDLDSVLMKIIVASSPNKETATHIDQKSGEVYDKMKSDTMFSLNLIEDLKKREAKLTRANFHKMLLDVPSDFLTKSLGTLEDSLFRGNGLKTESVGTADIMDAACEISRDAYYKEAFAIFKKKMKRLDPSTVDYVMIRKADIKSNDDKLMLVTYIYDKIDLINYYLDIMDSDQAGHYIFQNSRSELVRMKNALEACRRDILAYRIPEVRYGVQIMYPDGYTG